MSRKNIAALRTLVDKLLTLPAVRTDGGKQLRTNEPENLECSEDKPKQTPEAKLDALEKTLQEGGTGPTRLNMDFDLTADGKIGGIAAFALAAAGREKSAAKQPEDTEQTIEARAQALLGLDDRTTAALFNGPNYAGRQRRFIEPDQAAAACRLAAKGTLPENLWPTVDRETIHDLSDQEDKWMYHRDKLYEIAEYLESLETPEIDEKPWETEYEGPDEADVDEIEGYDWSTETTVELDARIHPTAEIGRNVSIDKNSRIDAGAIVNANVRDGVKIAKKVEITNGPDDSPTRLGENVTVGEGSRIHGGIVKDDVTIGTGATIEPGSVIGHHSTVGDDAVVTRGMKIPAYGDISAGAGSPAQKSIKVRQGPFIEDTAHVDPTAYLNAKTQVRGTSRIEAEAVTDTEVTIIDSTVGYGSQIGKGSTIRRSRIDPDVCIRKSCEILDSTLGQGEIGPENRIQHSKIQNGHKLGRECTIFDSTIQEGLRAADRTQIKDSKIGNRCRIRRGELRVSVTKSTLGDDVSLAACTDIKRSTLGDGTTIKTPEGRVPPRSTIKDSKIGARTIIGKEGLEMTESTAGQSCQLEGIITGSVVGNNVTTLAGAVVHHAKIGDGSTVGEKSVVDHGTTLGDRVKIEPLTRVGTNVKIGDDVVIGQGARVADGATIPTGTRIPAGGTVPAKPETDRYSSPIAPDRGDGNADAPGGAARAKTPDGANRDQPARRGS